MEDGWSLKKLVRRIVTSRTYRQSSTVTSKKRLQDIQNKWLARGPRFRLDAEGIRDNALSIAGLLSTEKGGPSIYPPQPNGLWTKVGGQKYTYEVSPGEQQYRRGIYVVLKRGSPYPSFMTFDASERMTCVTRRSRSNTPLQALTTLNDPVFVEAAQAFARRILSHAHTHTARLQRASLLALARSLSATERLALEQLQTDELAYFRQHTNAAATLVGHQPHPGVSTAELASWISVARALINLDEFITRE